MGSAIHNKAKTDARIPVINVEKEIGNLFLFVEHKRKETPIFLKSFYISLKKSGSGAF